MANSLTTPLVPTALAGPEAKGATTHISAKAAALVTARALAEDPATPTEHLSEISQFDPARDSAGDQKYVEAKPERYAIAAVFVDRAADDLVTKPDNPREARFIDLPDIEAGEEIALPTKNPLMLVHSGDSLDKLKVDIGAAVLPVAENFLDRHPELARAAKRFAQISEGIEGSDLDADLTTAERVVLNGAEAINNLVVEEFIPLMQRMLGQEEGNPELATEEQRTEAAKDAAQQVLFNLAAVNLGHLSQIADNEGPWKLFYLKDNLEGELQKSKNGNWTIKLAPGHERPAKPKTNLAGETINCPALLQMESDDKGSPLHRLVYATLNEARYRGLFSNRSIDLETYRHAASERAINALRQMVLEQENNGTAFTI